MATFTSIKEYRKTLAARERAIRKGTDRSKRQTAKLIVTTAKKLAPYKTGETIRGIRARKRKDTMIVESVVSPKGTTGFMQNMWSNRTAPHRSVKMWWNGYKKTVYGDGSHRTTGTPRWFHFAVLRSRPKFFKYTVANHRRALRVKA